jgi:cell division protein FtsB
MTDTDIREPSVGTLTRPAAPPQPQTRPRPPAQPQAPREPKGTPPSGLRREERSDERRGKTAGSSARRRAGQAEPGGERGEQSGKKQLPFFLLLCALLGGALVCALVISTTLAEGSFQITKLQQSNDALARQRQMLQEQVAAAQSAQVIESRARELGMRPVGELRFLNLRTGKVQTDAGSGAVAAISVPGYTP